MNLFERLPEDEVRMLKRYMDNYGDEDGAPAVPMHRMEYLLRFWNKNKEPLYKMFGEKFILKKDILMEQPADELADLMYRALRIDNAAAIKAFCHAFTRAIDNIPGLSYSERYSLRQLVEDYDTLVNNVYRGENLCIPGAYTRDGRPLQVNHGGKAVKLVGKIADALGVHIATFRKCKECGVVHEYITCPHCGSADSIVVDGYEEFRRAHSLVLNQKKIKGTLCLSIHPMDYITMSDNDSGWGSCMQWMEESGDYRLGTIEMMNSPYVIVAYVERREPMTLLCGDYQWNNKRWRQLLVATPHLLLGNRQYPYDNDFLQGAALQWLRELADGTIGSYMPEAIQLNNGHSNIIGERRVNFNLVFNYMYNDIYDNRMAYVSPAIEDRYSLNLSGPAVCVCCGEEIYYDDDADPSRVSCRACRGEWKCDCCGDWHCYEPFETAEGRYCDWCYNHELTSCEVCGERTLDVDSLWIKLIPDEMLEETDYRDYNWNYTIDVCRHCLRDRVELEALFGPISVAKDMFGIERQMVSIENISDEGLSRGSLSEDLKEKLTRIRDCKTFEDRLALIRKILY